jgi:hypothetical protein
MKFNMKKATFLKAAVITVSALTFGLLSDAAHAKDASQKGDGAMSTQAISTAQYEAQASQFKPKSGLVAMNSNDVRLFLYEWFTHFEHAAPVSFYLSHLDDKNMQVVFPGATPLISHADFTGWYDNLLAQTLWNFHDVSAIQIRQTAKDAYLVTFIVDWYGEVRANSEQLKGWQSRNDSNLYHHKLRQTWTLKAGNKMLIEKLVVTGGDTPSPIN